MGANFSASFTDYLRPTLGVVPVTMGQPQLDQPALLGGQDWLDVSPYLPGSVDQHRFATIGRSQQVGVRLDRPGGQNVKIHIVTPRSFVEPATVITHPES